MLEIFIRCMGQWYEFHLTYSVEVYPPLNTEGEGVEVYPPLNTDNTGTSQLPLLWNDTTCLVPVVVTAPVWGQFNNKIVLTLAVLVGFLTSVNPIMYWKFTIISETLVTVATLVRMLPCMNPHMA